MSMKSDYVKLETDVLIKAEGVILPGRCPILIKKGEDFSVVVIGSKITIDNHDSDERPWLLSIYDFDLVVCSVCFDDTADFGIFYRKMAVNEIRARV